MSTRLVIIGENADYLVVEPDFEAVKTSGNRDILQPTGESIDARVTTQYGFPVWFDHGRGDLHPDDRDILHLGNMHERLSVKLLGELKQNLVDWGDKTGADLVLVKVASSYSGDSARIKCRAQRLLYLDHRV